MSLTQVNRIMVDDEQGTRLPHDERYREGSAFLDGEYCGLAEATIPFWDIGFHHADAVYEKATVANGQYFRLEDHFARFARSCRKFRLPTLYSEAELRSIFDRLVSLTGLRHAGVFWCVTRGLMLRPDRANPDAYQPRFYAIAEPYASIATQEQRERGLALVVSRNYIRVPPEAVDPTAKNFNWADMTLALFEAHDREADWSVLTDSNGFLTEAPGANIFVVKNGELFTPDAGCLGGITRLAVMELAEMIGVRAHSQRVHVDELRQADDAFITSSAGGVMPVNSVDGVALGGREGVGELAARFHDLYWEQVWQGWKCAPVTYEEAAARVQ